MTCECWQDPESGKTALLWASCRGHADTVRVLVELGASLEAVDKVNIHAHALAYTFVSIRQNTSAYVSMSANVSIHRAYVSIREHA